MLKIGKGKSLEKRFYILNSFSDKLKSKNLKLEYPFNHKRTLQLYIKTLEKKGEIFSFGHKAFIPRDNFNILKNSFFPERPNIEELITKEELETMKKKWKIENLFHEPL